MKKQLLIFGLILLNLFLQACSPNKFTSNPDQNSTQPELDHSSFAASDFDLAISKIQSAKSAAVDMISNTKWKILGYHSVLKTTDGKGSKVSIVSKENGTAGFSKLQTKECPNGFVCTTVVQNYINLAIDSNCGFLSFNLHEDNYADASGALYKSWSIVLQTQSIKRCDSIEDQRIIENLALISKTNNLNLTTEGNFLFLENSDEYFIFIKDPAH